jgi:hypothetical protein
MDRWEIPPNIALRVREPVHWLLRSEAARVAGAAAGHCALPADKLANKIKASTLVLL